MIGPNSRLDTLQAAILLVKLRRLRPGSRRARRTPTPTGARSRRFELPPKEPRADPVWSAFVVRHPKRDALVEHLRARRIEAKVHYPIPIDRQQAFVHLGATSLPVTDRIVSGSVSLPLGPELSPENRQRVIDAMASWTP